MFPKVKKFLHDNRVAVLSIVDLEGFPHSAVLHYVFAENPFVLYFRTDEKSHKAQTLLHGETVHASVVVGFSEKEWLTVQMEGNIHIAVLPEEVEQAKLAFFGKFPNAQRGNGLVSLVFEPLFWKYTDFNQKPWKVITSKD